MIPMSHSAKPARRLADAAPLLTLSRVDKSRAGGYLLEQGPCGANSRDWRLMALYGTDSTRAMDRSVLTLNLGEGP